MRDMDELNRARYAYSWTFICAICSHYFPASHAFHAQKREEEKPATSSIYIYIHILQLGTIFQLIQDPPNFNIYLYQTKKNNFYLIYNKPTNDATHLTTDNNKRKHQNNIFNSLFTMKL